MLCCSQNILQWKSFVDLSITSHHSFVQTLLTASLVSFQFSFNFISLGSRSSWSWWSNNITPLWLYKGHYSQKNHCNDKCNDFSDYNDIVAPLDKLIMLHYYSRYMESIEHYCFMELESYKHFTFIWLLLSDIIFHWLTSWLTNIDKGTMAPMVACFHQNISL